MGVRMNNPFAWSNGPALEQRYFVWVNEKGVPYPQLWYGEHERERKTPVLSITRLELKHENLSFNELKKLFPYEPPIKENEK